MKIKLTTPAVRLCNPHESIGNRLLEAVVTGIAIGGVILVCSIAALSMESDRLWMVERELQSGVRIATVVLDNGWSTGRDYRAFDWSGYDEDDFPREVRGQIEVERARLATIDAKGGR